MFGSIRASAGEAVNHCGVRSWSTTITRMFGCAERVGTRRAGGDCPSVCSGTLVVGCWGGRRVRGGAVGVVAAVGPATSLATAAIAVPPSSAPPATTPPLMKVRLSIRRSGIGPKVCHRALSAGKGHVKGSKHRRLGVIPEHLLQRLDDLALRGAGAGAGEQRLHQVAIGLCGGLAQDGEGTLHLGAVARGARGL